ncbi:MAG: hypothetical protein R6U96_14605 [Promethearchaeia archaeon]
MSKTKRKTLQLERDIVENAEQIAKSKFEYRVINSTAEAIREILIDFIKKNRNHLSKTEKAKTTP